MVALAYLASIFAILSFFFFLFPSILKPKNGLPRNFPLIGMSGMLLVNFNHLYEVGVDLLSKSKGTFLIKGVWFTNTDMLWTSDPKNIHYITTTNFINYPKGPDSHEIFDTLGISLFNIDFDEWTFYRKALHAYFKRPQFHRFLNKVVVDNVNNGLMPVLEHLSTQGMVVDFVDVLKRHLLDAAWLFCTGYKIDTLTVDLPENPFGKAIDTACQAMFYRNIFPPIVWKPQSWLGIGIEQKLHASKKTVRGMIQDCLSKKKEELKNEEEMRKEAGDDEGYDTLKRLLLDPLEAGEKPHPELAIRDNVLGLIFAAYDTSSTTLSWLFYLLSKHPDVETKIRKEMETCFPVKKWRLGNKEELGKLVYLHSAIYEALRLYPPVPFQSRSPVKEDVLPSGHRVYPNTRVVTSGYASGRMKNIWGEDCMEFKPERWIDGNGNLKYETSAKFYIFNAGPRICPGKDIAFALMKAAAATIIYNFNIQVVETQPIIAKASIILEMKHGMRVKVNTLV
ncbi:alkane hydroxylase MAH1-like [Euphorbia lathyris]|uniref:alkane hydroxylase MAH1-like n=1 Tax=Euphorbia lathyris TaxID=212925 RepID=UPI003313595B